MNTDYAEEFRTRIYNIHVNIRQFLYRLSLTRNKYVTKEMDARAADEARDRAFPEVREFILTEVSKIREYIDESLALAKSIKAKKIVGLLSSIDSMLKIIIEITNRGKYPGPDLETLRSYGVTPGWALRNRIESYIESLY